MDIDNPRPRLARYLKDRLASIERKHVDFVDVAYVLDTAERLVIECEELEIQGLDKLETDISALTKLQSFLAELRTACVFARRGAKVKILKDREFGDAFYTPDLQVMYRDLVFLVEVFQSRPALPNVTTPLDEALKESGLPFVVESYLGLELSVPKVDGPDRKKQEDRVKEVIVEVIRQLSATPAGDTGEILVGEHCFLYEPSALGHGYAAGGVTHVHYIDERAHERKLLKDLKAKAEKQLKLPPVERTKPFIVAYDNLESELLPHIVLSLLTGPRTCYMMASKPPINHPPAVTEAWDSPWQPLLRAWNYGPDAETRFTNGYGVFGNAKAEDWAKSLSGVLVLHSARLIQWLPNPFAAPSICDVRLLDLDLPLDQLGANLQSLAA